MKGGENMEDLKELQKVEASNRLRILQMNYGLMENVINEFEQANTLYYSEYINQNIQGILYYVSNNEEFENAIKDFEEKHQALVYHAILTPLTYGRMLSLLYVSKTVEEWQTDREELSEGLPLVYCKNLDDDTTSEFGGIQIAKANGGITRIA
jgi:hypothetical protein